MTENSKKCLGWIKDNYGISFGLVDVNGKNIVDLVLEWHNKMLAEQEEKKEEEDKNQLDFKTTTDADGRLRFHRTHLTKQREESRMLHPGDIVKYESTYGNGIMIVNSFDYESDFVARSYIEKSYIKVDGTVNVYEYITTRSCPGFNSFVFANDEEIRQFFKDILDNNAKDFYYYFNLDSKSTPDYIKERYTHYIKELIA